MKNLFAITIQILSLHQLYSSSQDSVKKSLYLNSDRINLKRQNSGCYMHRFRMIMINVRKLKTSTVTQCSQAGATRAIDQNRFDYIEILNNTLPGIEGLLSSPSPLTLQNIPSPMSVISCWSRPEGTETNFQHFKEEKKNPKEIYF